ncbi:hypothetical protein DPM35_25335 [Mesorhizobium atlanticum]|uniref:Uncharacterized protein n=1 Tax=Mesorhizobium atlanticum TaxID=2233532 RepID=A0A330GKQ2_9HYPH|nr:hypothetical protein DPM35_25335 [Mesorhizobium atlanticum]
MALALALAFTVPVLGVTSADAAPMKKHHHRHHHRHHRWHHRWHHHHHHHHHHKKVAPKKY